MKLFSMINSVALVLVLGMLNSGCSNCGTGGSCASAPAAVVKSQSADFPTVDRINVARSLSQTDAQEIYDTAMSYAAFWNTGKPMYAKRALSGQFMDLNLPEGRPQGPTGPLLASEGFRKAVSDLSVKVNEISILEGKAVLVYHFTGTYTGEFHGAMGSGQKVDFKAVDIYDIKDSKIMANWHLEDNLSLLKQLEVVHFNK